MPSFAGFYATQDECQEWLKKYAPEIIKKYPNASTGAVELKAQEFMRKRRVLDLFFLESVLLPKSCPQDSSWALMLGCRSSKRKVYIAPDPSGDLRLRTLVESDFGLKVSEWTVIWYSKHDPDMLSEFLSPDSVPTDDE
ncbi:hypothetical protein OPQ81_003679 [Rhizoctonia solani]|nr:hypothetical protein OPQ81_003679 [Rhizoctonia solani]